MNCETLGVFCHGYGPKPAWKDKGEKEKEEAIRLKLQSRRRRSQSNNIHNNDALSSPAPDFWKGDGGQYDSSMQNYDELALSLSPHGFWDIEALEVAKPATEPTPLITEALDRPWTTPNGSDNFAELTQLSNFEPIIGIEDAAWSPFATTSPHSSTFSEKEVDLAMKFIEESKDMYFEASASSRSCLLSLLLRQPAFLHAALATSAYLTHLDSRDNSEDRTAAYHDYQYYRSAAARECDEHSVSRAQCSIASFSFTVDQMACRVQMAILEVSGYWLMLSLANKRHFGIGRTKMFASCFLVGVETTSTSKTRFLLDELSVKIVRKRLIILHYRPLG